jgi:hypothetical protein
MRAAGIGRGGPAALSFDEWLFALSLVFYIFFAQSRQAVRLTLSPLFIVVASFLSLLLLIAYLLAGQLGRAGAFSGGRVLVVKYAALLSCVALLVGGGVLSSSWLRHRSDAWRYVQDNVLQEEIAARALLDGRNPYAIDYKGTSLERWRWKPPPYDFEGTRPPRAYRVNPALFHVAYLPFALVAHVPFQVVSSTLLGWYDGRLLYLAAYLALLALAARMVRGHRTRLALLATIGLNPLLGFYVVEGRGDSVGLFLVLLTLFLAQRGRVGWSAVALGLACATRHHAWFLAPFWLLYVYQTQGARSQPERVGAVARHAAVAAVSGLAVILPFFLAGPSSFLDDTVGYLAGSAAYPYPMSGVGFGALVLAAGRVENALSPFPFWIFQALFGVPVMCGFLLLQARRCALPTAVLGYSLTVLVVMLFSRFFKDNYAGYVALLLTLAFFLDEEQIHGATPAPGGATSGGG